VRQSPNVVIQVPAHGCGQVAGLRLEPFEPLPVPRAAQRPIGLPGQGPVVLGMAMSDRGDVGPSGKPFGEECLDRVEHPRPRPSIAGLEADHAVAGERLGQIEGPVLVQLGDRCGCVDRPALDEHCCGLEQISFALAQQVDAPLNGGAQGPLALWDVDRTRPQQIERGRQPGQELVRLEQPDARRRQLDGRGRPSRRRQISATAAALPAVSAKL
jgi:hypothetical protein